MVFRSKFKWIERFLSPDRTVLDLGCVCHDLEQTAVPWLHGFLCERNGRVVGVDILSAEVTRMQQQGYETIAADVETMDLGERFDLIAAGDLIEHLDNPGRFLDRAAAHLKPDGLLLLTTPNPITYVRFMRVFLKGSAGANKQHTCWFTGKVLSQLAERHGFEVAEEAYVDDTRLFYPWSKKQTGGWFRRAWRHVGRGLAMGLLWKPIVLVNSLYCRLRPRYAETLCLALRVKGQQPND